MHRTSILPVKGTLGHNIKPKDMPLSRGHRKGVCQINPAHMLKEWKNTSTVHNTQCVLVPEMYIPVIFHPVSPMWISSCFLLLSPVAHTFQIGFSSILILGHSPSKPGKKKPFKVSTFLPIGYYLTPKWWMHTASISKDMCSQLLYPEEWRRDPQNSNTGLFCTVPPSRNISDSILSCNCTLLSFYTWKWKSIYPQNLHCLKSQAMKSQFKVSLGSSGWWWY